ncbi:MAG: choice-of-anchor B family protein, partial [Bacteroidota bacterium]
MIKRLLTLALFVSPFMLSAQTPCSGGMAGGYPCNGLTLQGYISSATMGSAEAQDSWGWTDPVGGKEYAIIALDDGTAFVDISTPTAPVYLGRLDSHSGGSSLWRDVKTYSNHAFIVSEVNDDGLQVFDLTRLRSVSSPPVNFTEDAHLFIGDSGGAGNDGRAHNIVINEATAMAYIVGVNRSSNSGDGPLFVDISNPTSPVIVGEYGPSDYFHDAQVVVYDGPDDDYNGTNSTQKEIMIGCNENEMVIVDVTNKSNPVTLSSVAYSNVRYTHQGWFTEDKKYFIVGDELDEDTYGFNTRTLVFDMTDLDNPTLHYTYTGPTAAIDHNGYVRGNRFYLANYSAGMRILKIDGLYDATPSMTEVNYFDTYPTNNTAAFNGAWNVYPFFESGNLVVSGFGNASTNGDGGLFILKDPNYDNVDPVAVCQNITATLDKNSGTVTIAAIDVDGGSTDNFGITKRTLTGQTTFTCEDAGENFNVTLTVEDDYGNKSSCVATVTVAGETTTYLGGGSWSGGAPDVGSNAKISADYNTSAGGNGSFSACTCEVDATRTLTVAGGDHINITKDIEVNGTLVVEHEGSVVQVLDNGTTTNNGTINVEQTTPNLASRDFMILGSPMTGETRGSVWSSAFLVLNAITANFVPHPDVEAQFPGAENFADDNNNFWNIYGAGGSVNPGEGYL